MIKVGLTGGIGSGKSLACEMFSSFGTPIIDADKISHQLTAVGSSQLDNIRSVFGDDIVDSSGALKRNRLRRIVFFDDAKRKQLEDILHPLVKKKIQSAFASLHTQYCIISIPLLVESNMLDLVDTIIVIDCSQSTQIEHIKKKGEITPAEALTIIEKQASRKERLEVAHIVVDNSGNKDELKKQVRLLHEKFTSQNPSKQT